MEIDTNAARDFFKGADRYTGAEVRLWVHSLADEGASLRAKLADALEVLRMVDDNRRVEDGEEGVKAWRGDFVDDEVRRVLGA